MTEIVARRDPNRSPAHPGELLRDDILPALGLSVQEAAGRLGVSRQALHRVTAGTAALTPEMAVRIGKLTGRGATLLLRMQMAHDLWLAERTVDVSAITTVEVAQRA